MNQNIIKTKKVIIEATKIFKIKYKKIQEEYKIIINYLYQNIYEITGQEENIKQFLINNERYIIRMKRQ